MVWRYTCLFAIAVVIASFVASLKQVALFLVMKGFDVCSISALLSIDVVTSRSILYRYNPLTPLTGEAKRPADMAYGYIRKEVKEDNSYTVLPGLRFIRGSTSEATQNQKETHRVEEVKANPQTVGEATVDTTMRPVVKSKVESVFGPGVNTVKLQPATRHYPNRSTRPRRATWKETKRSGHSLRTIPPWVRRPNVTKHEKFGTEAFRKEANHHILDMANRGACSSENCRAYIGSRRVEFDDSTDCTSKQPVSPRELLSRPRGHDDDRDGDVGLLSPSYAA